MLARRDAAPSLGLLRQIGELKRIRSAGRDGSIATRLFRSGWRYAVAGAPSGAMAVTAAALVATTLGDLDRTLLTGLGVSADAVARIRRDALDALELDGALLAYLRDALDTREPDAPLPPLVQRLERQPRAGATCPGVGRILFEPPESHAEHCLAVAVYGVLLAPRYGADAERVFLAGLAHHMHNALMPDSGYVGEVALGPELATVMEHATAQAMAELDPACRARVTDARKILPDADTPDGRAFHAADAIDRVLQIEQHLRPGHVSMRTVLRDMALVHEGPVKRFQDDVLAEFGLGA